MCTVDENVNWCSFWWKTVWGFLKKLKIELRYNPAIPLLHISPKKTKTLIQKDIRTRKVFVALFTIGKIWNHPECPRIDEGKRRRGVYAQWNIPRP